ncbi:MAG: alanine racemase [Planctomycetota bacterium]
MIQLRGPLTLPAPIEIDPPGPAEPSRLEIDLEALDHNVAALRSLMVGDLAYDPASLRQVRRDQRRGRRPDGQPRVCAVVKKDAYGLGASTVAHRLVAAGCDMLAVYNVDEAAGLVAAGIQAPILLFAPMRALTRTDALYRHAVAGLLELTIHDLRQLEQAQAMGTMLGIKVPVHLLLDTGLSRGGLSPDQLATALHRLDDFNQVRLAGLYSHLATAASDVDFAYAQLDRLEAAVADHADRLPEDCRIHLAATHATLRDPRFHLDMVRPGLGALGYGQASLVGPVMADAPPLRHAVRWVSRLIHVQRYPRLTPIGYDRSVKLRRESVVGLVPTGYADGYPRALSGKGVVRAVTPSAGPVDAKVLGIVNMDQITIDLTDAVAAEAEAGGRPLDAELHDWHDTPIELIGRDPAAPNALPTLAEQAKTTCYEMLCRLGSHVPRKYLNSR